MVKPWDDASTRSCSQESDRACVPSAGPTAHPRLAQMVSGLVDMKQPVTSAGRAYVADRLAAHAGNHDQGNGASGLGDVWSLHPLYLRRAAGCVAMWRREAVVLPVGGAVDLTGAGMLPRTPPSTCFGDPLSDGVS